MCLKMLNSDMQTIHMSDFKTFHVYRHDFFGGIIKLHPILSMKMSSLRASHGFSLAKSPHVWRLGWEVPVARQHLVRRLHRGFCPAQDLGVAVVVPRHGHPWRHGGDFPHFFHGNPVGSHEEWRF